MYCYFSLEYYDKENGIRGGGGLGVLAADTRRIAEEMKLPFVVVTPFYTTEYHQKMEKGELTDVPVAMDYRDFGHHPLDTVTINCNGEACELNILQKRLGDTYILAITEPNFGSLYQDTSGSDHRLYQEVALGFGGYKALKIAGDTPGVIQLNEVVTVFAAIAWVDDLVQNGMDFYEAVALVRKHAIYTNHTLVQAAEAEFGLDQFERYVFPNLTSPTLIWWLKKFFEDGRAKLSSIILELASKRNCVSKLHAKTANYYTAAGEKVNFRAITNGIDLRKWLMPEILNYYQKIQLFDADFNVTPESIKNVDFIRAEQIHELKSRGRDELNDILEDYPDQNGKILYFDEDDFIFDFKRRFVDYKRPEMPFSDPKRLREILEARNAHYILTGRIHSGDATMMEKLNQILKIVETDDYLKTHVHYLADYDERLAYGLSAGSNVAINLPIVGLEACGTSWMKDVGNMSLLISTVDGGVADVEEKYYFPVSGRDFAEEAASLYKWMSEAILTWDNDYELEIRVASQLFGYLPILSGQRMMKEYLDFVARM